MSTQSHPVRQAVTDVERSAPAKKNTKKWCKGVVGRPHLLPKMGEWQNGYQNYLCVLACERCGKHVAEHYESKWLKIKRPAPDWVPSR